MFGDLDEAMSIGVGLEDWHHFSRRDLRRYRVIVLGEAREVYFNNSGPQDLRELYRRVMRWYDRILHRQAVSQLSSNRKPLVWFSSVAFGLDPEAHLGNLQ